jgi:methylglutaconyl-CoA hydratase
MTARPASFRRLRREQDGPVARVALARPEARNAFDDELIAELSSVFLDFVADRRTRVVLLTGDGPSFCAGADVGWMRKAGSYSKEENEADAGRMARMLRAIDSCPKPVLVAVQGAAIGGGVGLVAAADIAIAAEDAVFSLAEVRLGLLPAVISPYVLRAIGARQARELFLTAERFDARRAREVGLVHEVVPRSELTAAIDRKIELLLAAGPESVEAAKMLIEKVSGLGPDEAMPITVRAIAERRASDEARKGLTAFLEKRAPRWVQKPE